jgi:hypothetical protein
MSITIPERIKAPLTQDAGYFECVAQETICDRPVNHAILCGAKVCGATKYGDPSPVIGIVQEVTVNTTVNSAGFTTYVTYKVLFEDGSRSLMQPLQLFRKFEL